MPPVNHKGKTMKIDSDYYVHGDRMSSLNSFKECFPSSTKEAEDVASGLGYEISFSGYWTDKGLYYATAINGQPLAAPVKLN